MTKLKKAWVISYRQYGTDRKVPYKEGNSNETFEFPHRFEAEKIAKQLRKAGHKKVKVIVIYKW